MWYEMRFKNRTDTSELYAQVVVPAGSLWFKGHFPGQPVLPGIAQMEMVLELICRGTGMPLALAEVNRVRFRKMILPDDCLTVTAMPKSDPPGGYVFRIVKDQEPLTTGTLRVRPAAGQVAPGDETI